MASFGVGDKTYNSKPMKTELEPLVVENFDTIVTGDDVTITYPAASPGGSPTTSTTPTSSIQGKQITLATQDIEINKQLESDWNEILNNYYALKSKADRLEGVQYSSYKDPSAVLNENNIYKMLKMQRQKDNRLIIESYGSLFILGGLAFTSLAFFTTMIYNM